MEINAILNRLTAAREIAGLSQAQAGMLINATLGRIKAIEENAVSISLEEFLLLCEKYGVSVEWVLTGSNPQFNTAQVEAALQRTQIRAADQQQIVRVLEMVTSA